MVRSPTRLREAVAARLPFFTRVALPALGVLLAVLLTPEASSAETALRAAVAANFREPFAELAAGFAATRGTEVVPSFGATGALYAQIRQGAPFDLFLAADRERPRLLEESGLALPGSRFTYAVGTLVLWSPRPGAIDPDGAVLAQGAFSHLAIANPRLAPYGAAAEELLRRRGLWEQLKGRLVVGESAAQAYHFVASGNAELGLVALSSLRRPAAPAGSRWIVPGELHDPIAQDAVLLREGAAARAFLAYLASPAGRVVVERWGYRWPGPTEERPEAAP